jgi:hypothetical protein
MNPKFGGFIKKGFFFLKHDHEGSQFLEQSIGVILMERHDSCMASFCTFARQGVGSD